MNPAARRKAPRRKAPAPTAPPVIAPLAVSVDEAARALGLGRTTLYAMMKAGAIESVRIGGQPRNTGKRSGRTMVPVAALHRFIESGSESAA